MNQPGNPPATQTPAQVRLDDAARVCGRVGHDFDNVLMGLLGFAELLQAQIEPGSRASRYLAELMSVAEGARDITRQLHAFNRSGRPVAMPTRLVEVCDPTRNGRLTTLTGNVGVKFDIPADLPRVAVGPEPLETVFGQLLRNAAEAMPAGGVVTMSGRAISSPAGIPDTLPDPLPTGEYLEVAVADTGPGIPPGILTRVGREPFVTTKTRRRGLGLPTALRALAAHGGGLRIESTPHGTAVAVYLPTVETVPTMPERTAAGT